MSQKYIEGDTFLLTYGDGVAKGRINAGYFVFHRRVFERLQNDPRQIFENEPLTELARDGQLMAHRHNGFWHCMDSSRDYKYLNDLWAEGKAPWSIANAPRLRAVA